MRITAYLSYRRIHRYSVGRLKRLEACDFSHVRFTKIDNIQAMVGIVTKLEGKNNNFAVIFNEQRKCDYSVNLNQNNKVSINDKLIVFYFEESSKLISPKSFIVQYGYVILPKGE